MKVNYSGENGRQDVGVEQGGVERNQRVEGRGGGLPLPVKTRDTNGVRPWKGKRLIEMCGGIGGGAVEVGQEEHAFQKKSVTVGEKEKQRRVGPGLARRGEGHWGGKGSECASGPVGGDNGPGGQNQTPPKKKENSQSGFKGGVEG